MSKKVTYAQLIEVLAEETGFSKSKAEAFSKALLRQVINELEENGKASITNFGSFKVKDVAERQGKNPQTGEAILIPAHKRVSFTPFKALKEEVNEEYAHLESKLMDEADKDDSTKEESASEETDPFAFEPEEEEPSVTSQEKEEDMEPPSDETEEQEEPESVTDMAARFELDAEPDEDTENVWMTESAEEDEQEDIAEPSRPFNFDEDDEPEEEPAAANFEGDEEEAFAEEEPEKAPVKAKSKTYQRDKDNSGILTLAILTVVVVAIASLWFFMSSDESEGQMAEQATSSEPMMAEDQAMEEEQVSQASANEMQNDAAAQAGRAEAEAEAQEAAPVEVSVDQYEVKANEWYWVISEKVYGESGYWPLLFQRNETENDDPDRLYPSAGLKIPVIEGRPGNLTKADYAKLAEAFQMVSEAYTNAGKTDKAYQYERNALRWARLANQ